MILSAKTCLRLSLCLLTTAAANLSVLGVNPANAGTVVPPLALQGEVVLANAPNATYSVIAGEVTYNQNTQVLHYCLVAPDLQVESTCATMDVSAVLTANDTGPSGGRMYSSRIDGGSSGSVFIGTTQTVPILHPAVFITRVATVDQSFDGLFTFPLTIAIDPNTGQFMPVIGTPY